MALEELRNKIDEIDLQLIKLLNDRARVVVEIGKHKNKTDAPIYVPDREKAVFAKIAKGELEVAWSGKVGQPQFSPDGSRACPRAFSIQHRRNIDSTYTVGEATKSRGSLSLLGISPEEHLSTSRSQRTLESLSQSTR